MLTGLTLGDRSALEQEHLAEARQRKKEKKKKQKKGKSRKHKEERFREKHKEKHQGRSESGSESSGSEDEWTKQQQQQHDSPSCSPAAAGTGSDGLQREDWMTIPMARSHFMEEQQQHKQEDTRKSEEPPAIAGIRYRNPEQAAAAAERAAARQAAAAAGGPKEPISASAGVNWRMKAVQRAQQLAKEQGKDFNEVLTERWGSAAEIAKGLINGAAAEAAAADQSGPRQPSSSHHAAGSRARGPAAQYLADVSVRGEQGAMKRPANGGSRNRLSWRQTDERRAGGANIRADDAPCADRGNSSFGDKESREAGDGRGRHNSRDRDRGKGERDTGGYRGREEQARDRDRRHIQERRYTDREQVVSRHRTSPDRGRHEQHKQTHSDRAGHQDGGRASGRVQGRGDGRHDRMQQQRQRDSRRAGDNEREHVQQQQKAEVMEALTAVAGHINTFSNDGSFMQQFTGQQQQQEPEQLQLRKSDGVNLSDKQQEPQGAHGQIKQVPAASAIGASAAAGSNRSTAELLRARLAGKSTTTAVSGAADKPAGAVGGNKSVADALRARLSGKAPAAAAAAAGEGGAGSGSSKGTEVVQLPLIDASGRAAPGAFGRETAADIRRQQEVAAGGRVAKRVQRYGADGQRERYFADDDNVDLQTLVKRAKHGDDSLDIDKTLASNIAASSRFRETDLDADAEYDYDAGLELSESRRKRGDVQQQRERQRQQQIAQFRKSQRLEENCSYCFSSPMRPKELAIAVGQATYLSLVQRGRLVEGHCCIVPAEHVASTRQVDDNTWTEIRNFQKCLIRMFMEAGKEVLFLETATALGTQRNHAIMECIPVNQEAFAKAPMYFKKALQEAESEWSQHASKSVIDTKVKGLRGSIPPNFPYLYVQFGYANGFVHVIDNENKFDKTLGRQVVAGLLKLPAEVIHRKQRAEAPQVQASMAAAFRKQFDSFDWTKALD